MSQETTSNALTIAEQRQLFIEISAGSQRALDRLVMANQGFVISLAKQYQGHGVDLDDLVSEGNIAMMMAAQKWNADKEPQFLKYAVWHIRRALDKTVERYGVVLRIPEEETAKVSSMDAPLRPGHSRSLGETMPQRGTRNLSDKADDGTILDGLEEGLYVLNEREQRVIRSYYGIGMEHLTMFEIGEEMGLKRERVRQIRKTAERKLRRPMREIKK